MIVRHQERARQRFTSSHTLLINLRRPGQDFQGGATRFFLDGQSLLVVETLSNLIEVALSSGDT